MALIPAEGAFDPVVLCIARGHGTAYLPARSLRPVEFP